MKTMRIAAAIAALALTPTLASAGKPRIIEFPNRQGTVFFNHDLHQKLPVGDCESCHKSLGEITRLGKDFAHKFCIGCHLPGPGKMEGPVECNECHTK